MRSFATAAAPYAAAHAEPRPKYLSRAIDLRRALCQGLQVKRAYDIIDEIDEAHYQRELKQFKKYSPDKDPDPEEEEYWRHETKHSIS